MPYDLYGNYYASAQDAYNAEMAQCAEIDSRLAYERVEKLEREIHNREQYQEYDLRQKVDYLMSKVESLEKEIQLLKDRKEVSGGN